MSGDLPGNWRWATIGEVASVQLGRQRSPQHHAGDQMRPYLRSANITWEGVSLNDVKEMNFDDNDYEKYRLELGDILLNEASGSPNEVGKPAVWRGEIDECCFQNTLLLLRPHAVDRQYLYWYCYTSALLGRFGEAGRGVNIRHLGKRGLAQFPIPVAPTSEQGRIVAAIEEHFSRLDAVEEVLATAVGKMEGLRRRVLTEAFAGRLVSQKPDNEPASGLHERISRVGHGDRYMIADLPTGWAYVRLGDLAADEERAITDGPFGSNLKTAHYRDSGPRVIRLQNIGDGVFKREDAHISREHYETLTRHSVQEGDLVVASLGETLPRACLVPGWVPPAIVKADCIRVRLNPDVSPAYVNYALQRPRLRHETATKIKGVGRPRLGLKGIKELVIPVAPSEEQGRIVAAIEEHFSRLDAVGGVLDDAADRVRALRRRILAEAFSGRLVRQDPGDEPASILLERISGARRAFCT